MKVRVSRPETGQVARYSVSWRDTLAHLKEQVGEDFHTHSGNSKFYLHRCDGSVTYVAMDRDTPRSLGMHLSRENEVVLEWRQGIRVTRVRRKKGTSSAAKPPDYSRRPVPKAETEGKQKGRKRKRVTWRDEEMGGAAAHADTALPERVPEIGEGESITFEVHMRRELSLIHI